MLSRSSAADSCADACCLLTFVVVAVLGMSIAAGPPKYGVVGPGTRAEFDNVVACDRLMLLTPCVLGEEPDVRAGAHLIVLGTGGAPVAMRRSNLCMRGSVDHLAPGSVGTCVGGAWRSLALVAAVMAIALAACLVTPLCLLLK